MITGVMTGFFMSSKLRPFLAAAYDVNAEFPLAWLQAEYDLGRDNRTSLPVGWIGYFGSRHGESFLFLHEYADRDTLFARFTVYLL